MLIKSHRDSSFTVCPLKNNNVIVIRQNLKCVSQWTKNMGNYDIYRIYDRFN